MPTIGHNGPTNEERLSWLRECQRRKRAVDEANGLLRSSYKLAKAAGMNMTALRATMRASNRDVEEVARDLRDTIQLMGLRNMPVTQQDLFGEDGPDLNIAPKAREEDEAWGAEDDGYRAGRNNVPVEDNPCEPETSLWGVWKAGWNRGQASLARELGEAAKAADPTRARPARNAALKADPLLIEGPAVPKRRGRPPGTKNRPKAAAANGGEPATIN